MMNFRSDNAQAWSRDVLAHSSGDAKNDDLSSAPSRRQLHRWV